VKAKDIAEKLGLSPASISLVMNNKPGVSKETREKVLQAMKEYTLEAVNEKTRHNQKTLLFLVHRRHAIDEGSQPYFSQVFENVIAGIENQSKQLECKLRIQYVDDHSIESFVSSQLNDSVDGIIVLATEITKSSIQTIIKCNIPIVLVDNYFQDIPIDCVVMNNEQGVHLAASYLIEEGHHSIGYIHVKENANNFQERYYGFMRSMDDFQSLVDKVAIIEVRGNRKVELHEQIKEQLSSLKTMPSAFFADNDIVAIEAYKALSQLGYKIPEDISVIGFDNISYGKIMNPPLTTIYASQYAMGKSAVNLLMGNIEKPIEGIQKIEIMTSLVQRQSVKHMNDKGD
jgi:LacI family transcriptional regulator